MSNPVKYSDFFDPQGQQDLDKAIKALTSLNTKLKNLFKTLEENGQTSKQRIVDLGKEISKFSVATEKGRASIKGFASDQEKAEKSFKENNKQVELLTKKIKALEAEIKKLKKARSEGNTALKEQEKLQQRLNKLRSKEGKEIARLTEQIRLQRKANKDLARETLQLDNAYQKLSKRTNEAQANFKRLAAEFGVNSKQARTAQKRFERLSNELREIDRVARDGRRNVGRYAQSFSNVGKNLLSALGVVGLVTTAVRGLSFVFREGFEANRNFELAIAKVGVVSGATEKELAQLEQQAKDLGATTRFSASEVAELQLSLSRLGFTADEIDGVTESITNLAAATDEDLGQTAEVVGNVIRALGLTADEGGRVADVLTTAFSSSALNLERFQESFKLVGPIARVANISLEDTTALLGKLSDVGLTGSIAGTGLKNVLNSLTKPSGNLAKRLGFTVNSGEDLIKAFKQLREEGVDLAEASGLVDERAKAAFLTFIDGVDSVESLSEALSNSTGSANAAAEAIGDTLDGDVKALQASFEALLIQGGALNNIFRDIVQSITSLLRALGSLNSETENQKRLYQETLFVQEDFVRSLKDQQQTEKVLLAELEKVIKSGGDRKTILKQINQVYPDVLKNIDAEKASYEDLSKAIKDANKQVLNKLFLDAENEAIQKAVQRQIDLVRDSQERDDKLIQRRTSLQKELNEATIEYDKSLSSLGTNAPIEAFQELDTGFQNLSESLNREIEEIQNELNNPLEIDTDRTVSFIQKEFDKIAKAFGLEINRINEDSGELSPTVGTGFINENKEKENRLKEFNEKEKALDIENKKALFENEKQFNRQIEELRIKSLNATSLEELENINEERKAIESKRIQFIANQEIELNNNKIDLVKQYSDVVKDSELQILDLEKANENELESIKDENFQKDLKRKQEELDETRRIKNEEKQLEQELANIRDQNAQRLQDALFQGLSKSVQDSVAAQAALVGIQTYLTQLKFYEAKNAQLKNASINPQQLALRDASIAAASTVLTQGFAEGGYTGDGGKYEAAGIVHKGEFVVDKGTTKTLGLDQPGIGMGDAIGILSKKFTIPDMKGNMDDVTNKMLNIQNISNNTSVKIDYDKFGKSVAKNLPKDDFAVKAGGHIAVMQQSAGRKKKVLFKNKNRSV